MLNVSRALSLTLVPALLIAGCREKSPAVSGAADDQADTRPSVEVIDPLQATLAEWKAKLDAASDDERERGKILFAFAGDESVPPYNALEFVLEHRAESQSLVGHNVKIMSRAKKGDAIEATRCFELIQNEPNTDATFHSLGRLLGQNEPAYGLKWLSEFPFTRRVYFATVNLGSGFAEYAAEYPRSEVEPLFESFLASPLFDGRDYDGKTNGEGSRMRERMTDSVLTALAKKGSIDAEFIARMETKVPEKCIPHLDTYPILYWPIGRVLDDFSASDFPERSRDAALRVARGRLWDDANLEQTIEWAHRLDNKADTDQTVRFTYRHFLAEADEARTMRILKDIDDPDHLRYAADYAKKNARNNKNDALRKRIEEFQRNTR